MPTILVFWFAQTWGLREALLGAMVRPSANQKNAHKSRIPPPSLHPD